MNKKGHYDPPPELEPDDPDDDPDVLLIFNPIPSSAFPTSRVTVSLFAASASVKYGSSLPLYTLELPVISTGRMPFR